MSGSGRPQKNVRVLFFCEAVTLAHVARPAVLSRALDCEGFEVHIAQHPRYRELLGELPAQQHDIQSLEPQQFMRALAQGDPVYSEETLRAYVEEDLHVIAAVQPDIVVGDFRISLQVSAAVAQVPYVALSNAYWSEYCQQRYVVPDLPFSKLLGPRLGQALFAAARPLAFALHCRPMNAVRRYHGLPALGYNLPRVYTQADYTLYADVASLYDMALLPASHRFIGPVIWSPKISQPSWWQDVPVDRPRIYVTLGSSGQADLLPVVVAALGDLEVTALISSAGGELPAELPDNVFCAAYLNGEEAVQDASLVICNGGSPTTQQALIAGVPVIGLASNLDQFLNMSVLEQAGAGHCMRAATCTREQLRKVVEEALAQTDLSSGAQQVGTLLRQQDSANNFRTIMEEVSNFKCSTPPQGGSELQGVGGMT